MKDEDDNVFQRKKKEVKVYVFKGIKIFLHV